MRPDNIKSIFGEYLTLKKTEYAILLNGYWGSGKTFFWKDTLINVVKEKGLKPIYLSLNGVRSIDALQQQLFIKLLPVIGKQENKTLKHATTITANLLNKASKAFIKIDFSDIFKGVSLDALNFDKIVICFDDLERCQMPFKELLGFINEFVEHKNLKCLILADEEKIKEIKKNKDIGYNSIKEKTIGRILNYEPDLETILPHFFNRYKENREYFSFLKNHQEYFLLLLQEFEEKNLRIISFILENLIKAIPEASTLEESYQKEIILFTIIISIEFKKGKLTSNQYQDYDELDNMLSYSYSIMDSITKETNWEDNQDEKTKKAIKEEDDLPARVYKLYLRNRITEYHFYPSIYSYILSGYFDQDLFKKDIDSRVPKESKPIRDLQQLTNYNFRKLDNTIFLELCKNVLVNAENGIYSIYEYERLADFYFFFSEMKLIPLTEKTINNKLFEGVNKAAKRKELNNHSYDTMQHFKAGKERTKEIRNEIFRLHEGIKLSNQQVESNSLLSLMRSLRISEMKELFKKNKYNEEFLFQIDDKEIFNVLISSDNEVIYEFNQNLIERYYYANPGSYIRKDISFLKKLKDSIISYLENNDDETGNLQRLNLSELKTNIKSWIEKLAKTEFSV
jgi:hypothetical protein